MSIPILDTHQHLVHSDRWPYSWTDGIPQLAGKTFHHDDYLKLIKGTGIEGSIFMETTPDDPHWLEEIQLIDQLIREPESLILGQIANCRPEERDGFQQFIESIHNDRLVGLRRFLHAVPDDTSEPGHFTNNLQLLARYNLTFDLCVLARQLPIATRIVRSCPDVQFVLDHCGVPEVADQKLDPWRTDIKALAEFPNVACKISGVLAYCKPEETHIDAIRPFVEHCAESFGPDRILWGSDWPVVTLTSSIPEWVATSRELFRHESESKQTQFFHQNAERIYGVRLK